MAEIGFGDITIWFLGVGTLYYSLKKYIKKRKNQKPKLP